MIAGFRKDSAMDGNDIHPDDNACGRRNKTIDMKVLDGLIPRAIIAPTAALCSVLLTACPTPGGGPVKPTVALDPECTIHLVDFEVNPKVDAALVSDRTDPASNTGFTHFRGVAGPRGNSSLGFTSDVYGFNEAWLRNPSSPLVFRAQAHPMKRSQFNDFNGSAWSIVVQDMTGSWSAPFFFGSANKGQEQDDPVAGGLTVPQLMPVGDAKAQMFACAGARSDDNAIRTTALFELIPPSAATSSHKSMFIQDLLSGDDRFVPNAPGPLIGPANPPTPPVHGPGNPVTQGAIQCAMVQAGDNLATRELHMLVVDHGRLYHAMANNWSTATTGNGIQFQRFNAVSQWADVGQALGGGFGNIVSATIVASRPQAVSVLFAAETPNGNFKLMHAVRFSGGGGSWRAPDDVLAINGGTSPGGTSGLGKSFQVAAGMCPEYQPPSPTQNQELVYVMWTADRDIFMGRNVSTARQWLPGLTGNYSPLFDISHLLAGTSDASRMDTINSMSVGTRPFRDDAAP